MLFAVVSWPAKRKMKALPVMSAEEKVIGEVAVIRGTGWVGGLEACSKTRERGEGAHTHEVQCVLLREAVTDCRFLELEEFMQIVVEVRVAFVDFAGPFEGEYFWPQDT